MFGWLWRLFGSSGGFPRPTRAFRVSGKNSATLDAAAGRAGGFTITVPDPGDGL